MTWQKHAFTTVSSLIMNCVIPVVVIIYLHTGCLGRWVSWWKTCQINSHLFQSRVIHNDVESMLPELDTLPGDFNLDITVLRPSDICDPHVSWSFSSMSRCIHITLLRLQEIWLSKFITTGMAMPGMALVAGRLPTESGSHRGQHWYLHGPCTNELRPSPINEYHSSSCILRSRIGRQSGLG